MKGTQNLEVAELQGLYGPVIVSEQLIQRIWLRGDFRKDALRTLDHQGVTIHHPGRWNLQEGPDFLGADISFGSKRIQGDVEIHFYEADWNAHNHYSQKRFDDVILHVIVFPPKQSIQIRTISGKTPATLCLLPYLENDLESYADDEILGNQGDGGSIHLLQNFLAISPEQRNERIIKNAQHRFRQKVVFARKRLKSTTWEQALHQLTLEVLGYRRNRAAMATLAQNYPPDSFLTQSADELFASQANRWKLAGLRPANHPKRRIMQYQELLKTRPGWQAQLVAWAYNQHIVAGSFKPDTKYYRKIKRLSAQRLEISVEILGNTLGGTRFDTWIVDALLPLLAIDNTNAWFPLWFHWFMGDMPEIVIQFMEQCELPPAKQPRCNGWAQGVWQLFIESGL